MVSDALESLVEAAISVCEPENGDEKATAYSRQTLRSRFEPILRAALAEAERLRPTLDDMRTQRDASDRKNARLRKTLAEAERERDVAIAEGRQDVVLLTQNYKKAIERAEADLAELRDERQAYIARELYITKARDKAEADLAAARDLLRESLMMFELTYGKEAANHSLMAQTRVFLERTATVAAHSEQWK